MNDTYMALPNSNNLDPEKALDSSAASSGEPDVHLQDYWTPVATSRSWIDATGVALIAVGVLYLVLTIIFPSLPAGEKFDIKIMKMPFSAPLSVVIILGGCCFIAQRTKTMVVVPVLKSAFRILLTLATVTTSLGLLVHFRIRKAGLLLAVLVLTAGSLWAVTLNGQRARRESSYTQKRLIELFNRRSISLSSRPDTIDAVAGLEAQAYFNRTMTRHPALNTVVVHLKLIYDIEDPSVELTQSSFRQRLSNSALRIAEFRASQPYREVRYSIDHVMLDHLFISIENNLSQDGSDPQHVSNSWRVAKIAAEKAGNLQSATQNTQDSQLGNFHAFTITVATARSLYFLGANRSGNSSSERARQLEEAYREFTSALSGNYFCKSRARNNMIDLQMKLLRADDAILRSVAAKESALADALKEAQSDLFSWYESQVATLTEIERYVRLPEVSLTRLQISGIVGKTLKEQSQEFCNTNDASEIGKVARLAFTRAISLGYRNCAFLEDFGRSYVDSLALCVDNESEACSEINRLAATLELNCTFCVQ